MKLKTFDLDFDPDLDIWHLTLNFWPLTFDLELWPQMRLAEKWRKIGPGVTLTSRDLDLWPRPWHLTLTFDFDLWPLTLTSNFGPKCGRRKNGKKSVPAWPWPLMTLTSDLDVDLEQQAFVCNRNYENRFINVFLVNFWSFSLYMAWSNDKCLFCSGPRDTTLL